MSYQVELDKAAGRRLRKLTTAQQSEIRTRLFELRDDPRPHNSKRLRNVKGGESWRIRVGKLGVLYRIDEAALTVVVYDVDVRQRVYKDLS